ncbi:hypothetical protein KIN20_034013 [Parelaphostrongylus tenuis]|uniref:Uncharacterized protein n=1 Tax=Parelaphostrongylus tenuis TaxID=148309 RepID=A0AAD5R8Z6_PARTN|nr:hypothetical protein KIN20_034013 [Parelaphostrongylus tenuis]
MKTVPIIPPSAMLVVKVQSSLIFLLSWCQHNGKTSRRPISILPSSVKEFRSHYRKLCSDWAQLTRAVGLKPSIIAQLKIGQPSCPLLYLLIKNHKLTPTNDLVSTDPSKLKTRPIISCVDGQRTG